MKKVFVFCLTLFILCIFPVFAYADEEPTSEPNNIVSSDVCSHSWEVVAFDPTYNVVTLKCSQCDLIHTLDFSDCLLSNFTANDEYFNAVDVNNDGVINGRDYAYLVRGFTNMLQTDSLINMFASEEFVYKEIFFFVYITILFICSTGFICFSIRRVKK